MEQTFPFDFVATTRGFAVSRKVFGIANFQTFDEKPIQGGYFMWCVSLPRALPWARYHAPIGATNPNRKMKRPQIIYTPN
jgi:hypothetical protein